MMNNTFYSKKTYQHYLDFGRLMRALFGRGDPLPTHSGDCIFILLLVGAFFSGVQLSFEHTSPPVRINPGTCCTVIHAANPCAPHIFTSLFDFILVFLQACFRWFSSFIFARYFVYGIFDVVLYFWFNPGAMTFKSILWEQNSHNIVLSPQSAHHTGKFYVLVFRILGLYGSLFLTILMCCI